MSERGSFTTEYIYCEKCLAAVRFVLMARKPDSGLSAYQIPSWCDHPRDHPVRSWWRRLLRLEDGIKYGLPMPIIAGSIGGLYSGEELEVFEYDIAEKLCPVICHPLRLAVIAEDGEYIFKLDPWNGVENPRHPRIPD